MYLNKKPSRGKLKLLSRHFLWTGIAVLFLVGKSLFLITKIATKNTKESLANNSLTLPIETEVQQRQKNLMSESISRGKWCGDDGMDGGGCKVRRWGCARRETPLIYIHIGKSGGGVVRERIAASAQNYTWKRFLYGGAFYQVDNNTRASLCNVGYKHLWSKASKNSTERHYKCSATSPLGQAIACPDPFEGKGRCNGCKEANNVCRQVGLGHNFLGSELHWLPKQYLSWWWKSTWTKKDSPHQKDVRNEVDSIQDLWNIVLPDHNGSCAHDAINVTFPTNVNVYEKLYQTCPTALQSLVDAKAHEMKFHDDSPDGHHNWSPLYASLPVLRTIVIRDPFSWLLSKFFWHSTVKERYRLRCDNVSEATEMRWMEDIKATGPGWAYRYAMQHIFFLCGVECEARYVQGLSTLSHLEIQAESNLRQSIAVVGLLNETNNFFDMVTARVGYVNTSLSKNVKGPTHMSATGKEKDRCKEIFHSASFQSRMVNSSEAIAALVRLYKTAVEVNRFQLNELANCDNSVPLIP